MIWYNLVDVDQKNIKLEGYMWNLKDKKGNVVPAKLQQSHIVSIRYDNYWVGISPIEGVKYPDNVIDALKKCRQLV